MKNNHGLYIQHPKFPKLHRGRVSKNAIREYDKKLKLYHDMRWRVFPTMILNELVTVHPLSSPTNSIYYYHYKE